MMRHGIGMFRSRSAGSMPGGDVHPLALDLLRQRNDDASLFRLKSWEEFAADSVPKLDFVFSVCDKAAQEVCSVWTGQPMTAHWGVPDPARVEGTEAERRYAFADVYRML